MASWDKLSDRLKNSSAGANGRVNVSPKGMDTLKVLSDKRIIWLNLTGSGNETAAHVQENGRMTLMFCAFEGDALILRVYGQASVVHPRDDGWDELSEYFEDYAGRRQVFDLTIEKVQTSCGTGVPIMPLQESRGEEELLPFYQELGPDGVQKYWKKKNTTTIDGKDTGILD